MVITPDEGITTVVTLDKQYGVGFYHLLPLTNNCKMFCFHIGLQRSSKLCVYLPARYA